MCSDAMFTLQECFPLVLHETINRLYFMWVSIWCWKGKIYRVPRVKARQALSFFAFVSFERFSSLMQNVLTSIKILSVNGRKTLDFKGRRVLGIERRRERKKENDENNYCWKTHFQRNGTTKDIIIPRKWEEPAGDYIQDTLIFINFNILYKKI